jgi:hypothetical protein
MHGPLVHRIYKMNLLHIYGYGLAIEPRFVFLIMKVNLLYIVILEFYFYVKVHFQKYSSAQEISGLYKWHCKLI